MESRRILFSAVAALCWLLAGCNATDEEIARLEDFEQSMRQNALKPSIDYPAEGAVVDESIRIKVHVDEDHVYDSVVLLVNGEEFASDNEAPYEFDWQPYFWTFDSHVTLKAVAKSSGKIDLISDTRSVNLNTDAFSDVFQASQMTNVYPFGTTTVPLSWNAINEAVSYEYRVNDGEPMSVEVSTATVNVAGAGVYRVSVRAKDAFGHTGKWNYLPDISVLPASTPVVDFVTGSNGEPSRITVSSDQSNDIRSVSFFAQDTKISTVTEPPYTFEWDPYFWAGNGDFTWHIAVEYVNGVNLSTEKQALDTAAYAALAGRVQIETAAEIKNFNDYDAIDFIWSSLPDAEVYEFQVNDDVFQVDQRRATAALNDIGEYNVRVRGIDASGRKGIWSNPYTFVVEPAAPPTVIFPQNLATLRNVGEVAFSWGPQPKASRYELMVDGNVTSTTNHSLIIKTPDAKGYSYKIRSIDLFGRPGAWSQESQFYLLLPPAIQFDVAVVDSDADFAIRVNWAAPAGADSLTAVVEVSKDELFEQSLKGMPLRLPALQEQVDIDVSAGHYFVRMYLEDAFGRKAPLAQPVEIAVGLFNIDSPVCSDCAAELRPGQSAFVMNDSSLTLFTYDANNTTCHLSEWNLTGEKLWEKTFNKTMISPATINRMTDRSYLLSGFENAFSEPLMLMVDNQGNLINEYSVSTNSGGESGLDESGLDIVSRVGDVTLVNDALLAFTQITELWKTTDQGSRELRDKQYVFSLLDRESLSQTDISFEQPATGLFGDPQKILYDGKYLFVIGKYELSELSAETPVSGDSVQISDSGAYLVVIDPESASIINTRSFAGLSDAVITHVDIKNAELVISYYSHRLLESNNSVIDVGAATVIGANDQVNAYLETEFAISHATLNNDGDLLVIGNCHLCDAESTQRIIVKYRNGVEIDRTYVDIPNQDFDVIGVMYDQRYGLVISGTYHSVDESDVQRISIFNITDKLEFLDLSSH